MLGKFPGKYCHQYSKEWGNICNEKICIYRERYYNHDNSIFDLLEATGYEVDDAYSLFVAEIH